MYIPVTVFDPDQLPPEIVADYHGRLDASRQEIEGLVASLPAAGGPELRRIAHRLRGTGAIFGHPLVSQVAGEVEDAPLGELAAAGRRLADLLQGILAPAGERILLVDDDPAIVRLLAATLQRPGRQILTATTGAEAAALLARERCDLVLLDLFLPDDDGRRLLGRWRGDPATSRLPVFILSARLGSEVKAECYALGADGYFEKPFDPKVLAAAVQGRLHRPGPAPAVVAPPAAGPRPAAGPARILVVEDDHLIARIVTHRLEKAGHHLTHLPDGGTVLAQVARERPDLIILDIKMPEVDGLEVLRRLRADAATRSLPVILLTALGDEADVVRGFGLGADDYLVKPFSPTELAVRVDRLLHRP